MILLTEVTINISNFFVMINIFVTHVLTCIFKSCFSTLQPKKSVFSGFGGFNKTQPSSFDFLANLTNGNKTTNGSGKVDSEQPLCPVGNKVIESEGHHFYIPISTTPSTKTTFGTPTTQMSPFGRTGTNTTTTLFGSTTGSPFKIPTSTGSTEAPKQNNPDPQASSVFATNISSKSVFGLNTVPSTPSQISTATSTPKADEAERKEEKADEKKMNYYSKLKGLNESVSDWIKKHVEETPLCILSPIFKDYEKYLKEIQEEFHGTSEESKIKMNDNNPAETKPIPSTNVTKTTTETLNTSGSSIFAASNAKVAIFGSQNATVATTEKPSSEFPFGIKTSSSTVTTTSGGFSFGINTGSSATTTSAPFLFTTNTTGVNGAAPFSFGTGKPFSFSSNIQTRNVEKKDEDKEQEDDEPPKVEFTPVVEENSVFDKKCKVFIKKDGNFVDKGVGTLYVKKIEESGKHQLLVRANTNLGTVTLNMILSASIPMQRLGKNNVMLVCIPTPDHKPPPTTVLIRVKTSEEADELLETLNKYKA